MEKMTSARNYTWLMTKSSLVFCVLDPSAFLIVCDAHEVLGQGFHSYHQHDL